MITFRITWKNGCVMCMTIDASVNMIAEFEHLPGDMVSAEIVEYTPQ